MMDNPKDLPTLQPKIIEFHPIAMPAPTPMGVMVIVYGLGDDSKMYQWSGKDKKWVVAN
jgi:hypothetical protein